MIFLGIEAVRDADTIVLTQNKYTLELLDKAKMLDSKTCDTPVVKALRVSIHDDNLLANASEYKTIVGDYNIWRPDISFGVNYVSKFIHAPTDTRLQLVKEFWDIWKGQLH